MRYRPAALLLLGVQLALVLSVAGKYWYERRTCPRVWVRATQRDPEQPLRGRYLALQLLVDACGLPQDRAHYRPPLVMMNAPDKAGPGSWVWMVSLRATSGHLVPSLDEYSRKPEELRQVILQADRPCERAPVQTDEEYFIPEHAKGPFPLRAGQELWVEVTVPPSGPPRPIQLALADGPDFRPLRVE